MKKIGGVQKEYMIRFAEMDGVDINIAADIFGLRPRTLRDWVSKAEKSQIQDTPSEQPSDIPLELRISTLERKFNNFKRISKIRR
ncbi:hypothetical protein [Peribacillus sp. NPDC055009]